MSTAARRVVLGLAGALLAAACDPTAPPSDEHGVQLLLRANLSGTAATMVVAVVSAPDITPELVFNIPVTDAVANGTITVPAGSNRTITLHAYDAGGVETHRGAVTLSIHDGANPTINLILTPLAGDVPIDVVLGTFLITVTPPADTFSVGATAPFTATITGPGGATVLEPVVWATLNPGIATIASTGDRTAQVTAVAPGATTIVATYGGSGGTSDIIVSASPRATLIASGLNSPLYVTQAPGDTSRLFIVEQAGRIKVRRNGAVLPTAFLDVTALISFGGERGLLSMAFHPNYANNGQFFVCYTDLTGTIQVFRYTVSANPDLANAGSAVSIITVAHPTFSNHNGGLIVFGPDGFLYIGLGDGGSSGDPAGNGQNKAALLGKILRIDVNSGTPYVVPADNPFVGLPPARPEVWVYGLRNPWRFAFDRANGNLYIADVGQGAREEINVQAAASNGGENYGWNIMEGTICYPPPTTGCNQTGLTLPVFDYTHAEGCSITGGYVYRGKNLPILGGHYFYADYCGGWVRSFRYVNGTVVDQRDYTPEFGTLGNITSFGEDLQGELYITTQGGNVYRIMPAVP